MRTKKWMKIWDRVWNEKRSDVQKNNSFIYEYRDIESKNWIGVAKVFLGMLDLSLTNEVLELGCGSGAFLSAIQDILPNVSVSGCDISQEAIDIVVERLEGIFLACEADIKIEEFSNGFDLVSAFSVLTQKSG